MSSDPPRQREVWLAALDPVRGSEQAGNRPVLVCSVDRLNLAPIGLCVVMPLTTTDRGNPLHLAIEPPEGGVRERSFVLPEMVRAISHGRLSERWGRVRAETLAEAVGRATLLLRPA